jgi:superfamily II DNA/RNA helicase
MVHSHAYACYVARGLDIPAIKVVVNYDCARDIDTHTHRIGRTGRAGQKGTAYTLVTQKEDRFAAELVRNLEGANQQVSPALLALANKVFFTELVYVVSCMGACAAAVAGYCIRTRVV